MLSLQRNALARPCSRSLDDLFAFLPIFIQAPYYIRFVFNIYSPHSPRPLSLDDTPAREARGGAVLSLFLLLFCCSSQPSVSKSLLPLLAQCFAAAAYRTLTLTYVRRIASWLFPPFRCLRPRAARSSRPCSGSAPAADRARRLWPSASFVVSGFPIIRMRHGRGSCCSFLLLPCV